MKADNMTMRSPVRTIGLAMLLGLSAISSLFADAPKPAEDPQSHAAAFRQMRYGIFVHNVYGLTGWPDKARTQATLDEFTNAFDAKGFAEQMAAVGAEYVFFTAWHKSFYLLGPNAALERWLPGHTAKRDLVGEVADALHAKGIKLVIYAHPNDWHDLTREEQERVGFTIRTTAEGKKKLNDCINEVYAGLSERYAKKPNVIGFWWDNWWANGGPLDMPRLRQTVRNRFPAALTLSNMYDKRFIDLPSIEVWNVNKLDQVIARRENQTFPLFQNWWSTATSARMNWTPEDLYRILMLNLGCGAPGGTCLALSPLADGISWPGNGQSLEVLLALGKLIAPVRPSICGVLPSRHWRMKEGLRWPQAPAFVAARSTDGGKEYVHVLKPPAETFIELPKPAEAFSAACLYLSRRPVAMEQTGDILRLTLPEGEAWNELDTVIELKIAR